jgi:hypothetical protein
VAAVIGFVHGESETKLKQSSSGNLEDSKIGSKGKKKALDFSRA